MGRSLGPFLILESPQDRWKGGGRAGEKPKETEREVSSPAEADGTTGRQRCIQLLLRDRGQNIGAGKVEKAAEIIQEWSFPVSARSFYIDTHTHKHIRARTRVHTHTQIH